MSSPARLRTRSGQQARRHPRLRLACLRCQKRKIKCDGELPTCKHCRNAGVSCTDGESARLRDLPRDYIRKLKQRISWLENVVRDRCPDVDLGESEDLNLDGDPPISIDLERSAVRDKIITPDDHNNESQHVAASNTATNNLSHEIGLVSLGANIDPRYIGPSSGHLLARVMLTRSSTLNTSENTSNTMASTELVEALYGPSPLPPRQVAEKLCEAFFEIIHPQYPILHKQTLIKMIDQSYAAESVGAAATFQVFMVLAIGATVLSGRQAARLPGESYCLSALQHFEQINLESSLQGVQCLLLLMIFAFHSPHVRFNIWYLNYHCIAALLDLGLQREISSHIPISLLDQELRTRIFWTIFTFDRVIATMMGRPIGLREEACELRLPQVIDDSELSRNNPDTSGRRSEPHTQMSYAVHLFRLAKLNSEIKYVANSVNRDRPNYAYPQIVDLPAWQKDALERLDQWALDIPNAAQDSTSHMHFICKLRYHSVRMLLLRPSPAIPKPSIKCLEHCYESAKESIRIFDRLYRNNMLVHSWTTFHSLVLSTLTMLYCIKVTPRIARQTKVDALMGDMTVGLSILSATGEHWSGAKRCRDILDDLGRSTIRFLQETNSAASESRQEDTTTATLSNTAANDSADTGYVPPSMLNVEAEPVFPFLDQFTTNIPNAFGDGSQDYFGSNFEATDSVNIDNIVRELFQDFIPAYPPFE